MAKHRIHHTNGKPSAYFWSDRHGTDRSRMTMFKETEEGVKRMKNAFYNAVKGKILRGTSK